MCPNVILVDRISRTSTNDVKKKNMMGVHCHLTKMSKVMPMFVQVLDQATSQASYVMALEYSDLRLFGEMTPEWHQ